MAAGNSQEGIPGQNERSRALVNFTPLIYISFFLSGTAGLLYEIVWMRFLTISFGSMVFAVGAVLSSFMAGLAIGNFVIGKASDRLRKPLLTYALLEAGIGVTALLVPWFLNLTGNVSPGYGIGTGAFFTKVSLTFVFSFLVLVVPTGLMGGTLPLLSRALIKRTSQIAERVGLLYSINTFGAVVGVALGGMVILQLIGMKNTTLLAATLNFTVALLVGVVSLATRAPFPPRQASSAAPGPDRSVPLPSILLVAIALSGLASMVYEVCWTRSLALVIGSSVYAFSTMLLSFIFGIALGSLLFACVFRKKVPSLHLFAYLEIAIALACFAVILSFDRLPAVFMRMYSALAPSLGFLFIGELVVCFLVMLVPTVLFGATLPMVCHMFAGRDRKIGSSVGTVYAANTLGCIAGSTGASFLLIPLAGLETTLKIAVSVNVVASLLAFGLSSKRRLFKHYFVLFGVVFTVLIFLMPKGWNKRVMSVGVAPNAVWLEKLTKLGDLETIASIPELLYYKDGLSATVAVKKDQRDVSMSIDGKTDASAVADLPTQLLVGYLPLFLHGDPQTVMVLGLGSGVSLAATISYGVEYSECLEIEPAVIAGSRFFSHVNRNVLEDPKARILLADGRHYLGSTENLYDVITSEPSNPWMAGISSLFTKEFYKICASKLNRGGVMCQFIHGYNLAPGDFRMVMATFSSVFPYKQLWSSAFGADYLMVGSFDSIRFDPELINVAMEEEEVSQDLAKIGIEEVRDLAAHFLLADSMWDNLIADSRINTDDKPILEFSAPKTLYLATNIVDSLDLHPLLVRDSPGVSWTEKDRAKIHMRRGDLFLLHDFLAKAIQEYSAASLLLPEWYAPYVSRAGVLLSMARKGLTQDLGSIARDLNKALELESNAPEIYEKMSLLAALQGEPERAVQYLKNALEIEQQMEYYEDLVDILVDDLGNYKEAKEYVDEALAMFGEKASLLEKRGFIAEVTGQYADAVFYFQRATDADTYSPANYRLGRLLLSLDQPSRALRPLERAVRLGPTFPETHIALARAYAATGERRKAIRSYRRALQIDPENAEARKGLESLD